jgi:hypothetical protein
MLNTSGMRWLMNTIAMPRSRSRRIRLRTSATCLHPEIAAHPAQGSGAVAGSHEEKGRCVAPPYLFSAEEDLTTRLYQSAHRKLDELLESPPL